MSYKRVEGALHAAVWAELPAYGIADAATEALVWVIGQAGFEAHEGDDEPPATYWRAKALGTSAFLACALRAQPWRSSRRAMRPSR